MITALYSLTLLVSAFLLFCIEPLVAKMLLPFAGGATAVWSTCLVFFQATLLLGYVFSHGTLRALPPKRHVFVYALLFPLALATMPIMLHGTIAKDHPAATVLVLLAQAVGAPFFVLSTLAPALQRWFSATGEKHAADPYFLYAASNIGSMVALAAYPLVIEPYSDLSSQSHALRIAFAVLAVLVLGCAIALRRGTNAPETHLEGGHIAWSRRARWVLLAAIPSAQLVAVTTYLTTEVAPAPLLWAVPLATYLLTFVIVFSRKPILPTSAITKRLPLVAIVGVLCVMVGGNEPAAVVFTLHVVLQFLVAMFCHGTIAADRPPAARLPEYFAWVSLGGVVGGAAAALGAPLLFTQPLEYPICFLLALACLPSARAPRWAYAVAAGVIAMSAAGAWLCATRLSSHVALAVATGVPLLGALSLDRFPRMLTWTLAAALLAEASTQDAREHVIRRERSFYGAFSVTRDADGTALMHGNTMHGIQLTHAPRTATLCFTAVGPAGDILGLAAARDMKHHVAVIGLGTGTLATYASPGDRWRFFELDPAVVRIARDPHYFTFLSDTFADGGDVVTGDARIEIVKDEGGYDLLVVDAFTSDSIPTHLLTREAFALYRSKLVPGSIIGWNVSNRHLDLRPALGTLATDASWHALAREDLMVDERIKKNASRWVVMAASPETLTPLLAKGWQEIPRDPNFRVWTDERASIVTVW